MTVNWPPPGVSDLADPAYWRVMACGDGEWLTRQLCRHGPACADCRVTEPCAIFDAMRVVERELTGF